MAVSPEPYVGLERVGVDEGERCFMYEMKNLEKLGAMKELSPKAMKAFWEFDKAAMEGGAIPAKYKELMAVAVAMVTQCPYCIEIHTGRARQAGASDTELTEAVLVAAALRAGASMTHGTHVLLGGEK
jgi:AhpD family alkylhydroperoxidase